MQQLEALTIDPRIPGMDQIVREAQSPSADGFGGFPASRGCQDKRLFGNYSEDDDDDDNDYSYHSYYC